MARAPLAAGSKSVGASKTIAICMLPDRCLRPIEARIWRIGRSGNKASPLDRPCSCVIDNTAASRPACIGAVGSSRYARQNLRRPELGAWPIRSCDFARRQEQLAYRMRGWRCLAEQRWIIRQSRSTRRTTKPKSCAYSNQRTFDRAIADYGQANPAEPRLCPCPVRPRRDLLSGQRQRDSGARL